VVELTLTDLARLCPTLLLLLALGCLAQVPGGGADDTERRGEVHVEHRLPLLVGHLVNGSVPGVTRVVDDRIDPPESVERLFNQARGEVRFRHVARHGERVAVVAFNCFGGFMRWLRVNVREDDARAVRREKFSARATDAAARACDDRYLAF